MEHEEAVNLMRPELPPERCPACVIREADVSVLQFRVRDLERALKDALFGDPIGADAILVQPVASTGDYLALVSDLQNAEAEIRALKTHPAMVVNTPTSEQQPALESALDSIRQLLKAQEEQRRMSDRRELVKELEYQRMKAQRDVLFRTGCMGLGDLLDQTYSLMEERPAVIQAREAVLRS